MLETVPHLSLANLNHTQPLWNENEGESENANENEGEMQTCKKKFLR